MARKIVGEEMLTAGEVARLFRVDPKTVTRWADKGLLHAVRVYPAAQRRFRLSEVEALLSGKKEGERHG